MGSHFDFVITCDLREDTPDEVVKAIQCLTTHDFRLDEKPQLLYEGHGNIWDSFDDYHFLAPDPKREVVSSFQRMWRTSIPAENNRKVYRYSLQYSGRNIHDDFWAAHHIPFIYWLAAYVFEDFIGYMRETTNSDLDLIFVKDGKLAGDKFNPPEKK